MEVLRENQLELAVCSSTSTFQDLLESQQELFRCQIDQLQNIVITQCKLTGVNPLSQEMAAGALSIKIGKRPRDLLNPKAVKYMQSVFSIKDAISKKESREISALFGVTITQVRDFFNSQRTRVRKFVRLSREKALRSNMCKEEAQNGVSMICDSAIPINLVPLNSIGPTNIEEGPSCSTQDETLPGIDDSDKNFLDNIFPMMRNEETFSGQVKLMEWILQIHNSSVLNRFLTKGGVMILATWLSQAATEEQTSVLRVILKVLCHLPLHKALPVHMSAILQSVNRLRFYKTSDISNRARILLSRWSKIFARSQATKKPNANKSLTDAQDEMLLKRSISEIMGNELWERKCDIPDSNLAPSYDGSENFRKLEAQQPLKLLPASTDDSNRKLIRGISSSQTRERRKVLMVEQPGQKLAGRSAQAARSAPATQGRPLSADDIQKAKMRAQFMQTKYGRNGTSSNEGRQIKSEVPNRSSESSILFSASKTDAQPKVEEPKKPVIIPSEVSNQPEASLDNKMTMDPEEPLWKKCRRVQIPWVTPPEIRINAEWNVGTGENSKEVEVQRNRIRREKEIAYKTAQEIPSDPKEPWDREMDYDDTLTPEIPIEQLPDAEDTETTLVSPCENKNTSINLATTSSQNVSESMPEPDLELLAVLLKNPELVFALTSGQGGNLSSEETVKLLDMLKANGVSAPANLSGLDRKTEKVEVSLPSPTPSGDPVTSGWRPEVAKHPFSRQSLVSKPEAYATAGIAETIPAQEMHPAGSLVLRHIQSVDLVAPHHRKASPTLSQQTIPHFLSSQTVASLPEQRMPPLLPTLHQIAPSTTNIPTLVSGMVLNQKHVPLPTLSSPNLPAALPPADAVGSVKAAPLNTPDGLPLAFSVPPLLPTPTWPEPQLQPPAMPEPRPLTHPWRVGRGLASNLHSQEIQNNYNNALQPQVLPGRNEFTGQPGFETWSPENSPIRSPEHMSGWNFPDSGMSIGDNYRIDRPRMRNSSGYRDHNRYGNRRWRERERDRDRDRDRRR